MQNRNNKQSSMKLFFVNEPGQLALQSLIKNSIRKRLKLTAKAQFYLKSDETFEIKWITNNEDWKKMI